jgi:hypothetical protein
MTNEHRKILQRINAYSESVLGNIDPQKVQVSAQLEKLKPVMEEIANELNMSLTDVFILYMDLQTEASMESQRKLKDTLQDINGGDGMPMLFR